MNKDIIVYFKKTGFRGGPKIFRDRLRPVLKGVQGLKIVSQTQNDMDIELAFIRSKERHTKPIVLRVDGCYYRKDHLRRNASILASLRQAKHIIFQSNYSMNMVTTMLKYKPKKSTVIYNGIDQSYVDSISKATDIEPDSFVAVSHGWRKRSDKRIHSTIMGFLSASLNKHLYIIGDVDKYITKKYSKNNNVHFLGVLIGKRLLSVMKACKYQMHLCRIDSCPNAVVEGLACGLNVLCTNLGGTREIVKNDGIILDVDQWNFSPIGSKNYDNVSPNSVADGIELLLKIKTKPNRPDINIKKTAEAYANVIKKEAGTIT